MHDILYELAGTNDDGGSWKFTSSSLDEILLLQEQIGGTLGCNQPRGHHFEPERGRIVQGRRRAFARLRSAWARLRDEARQS